MSDDVAGSDPEPSADPTGPTTQPVHHGEALVAALLNPQNPVVSSVGPVSSRPAVSTEPLTAAAVLAETEGGSIISTPTPVPPSPVDQDQSSSSGGDDGSGDNPSNEDSDEEPSAEGEDEESSLARNALEWVVVLGAAVAVAIILRTFVFQAFFIPSESMETLLFENDRILVNKVSYRLHDVNRGDVVVFRRPDEQPGDIRDLIKRVIALPGETIEGRDSQIYINDQLLIEPYLDGNRFSDFGPTEVPEGELFMMGDNRDQSLDSRRFGTIEEERIVGRAFFLFWPFDRVGSL